jgi:ATP synthase I chain
MAEDERFFEAAERRIEYLAIGIGAAGAVVASVFWGLRHGAWFAAGAALSWLNFRWMKQGIAALARLSAAQTGAEKIRVPRTVYVKFVARYLLLILVAYVILRGFKFAMLSLLAGLFVIAAAVLAEMIGQLFRGGAVSHTDS